MTLLGIDLGTSSVKVMVLDERGSVMSLSKADYPVLSIQPGWSESNPDQWWSAVVSAVQTALAQAPQAKITAIGLSGQMHGIVLTDEGGSPLRPAILWADTRAANQLEHYRKLSPALLSRLANPLVPGMAGPLLCWLAEHEKALYHQARWVLQPKDWLRMRLTNVAATDPSDASATLLYDLLADDWSDEIVKALGLERYHLPPIVSSASMAGKLSKQAASALNLPEGVPVATGAADTAAAALGSGLLTPGTLQLTLGTGAQLIQLSSEPKIDPTGRTHLYRAADGVHWYTMAAVQNAGLALNWVCQIFNATWDELYASATHVSTLDNDLFFFPYLTRERPHHPAAASRGAFLGLRIDHQRKDLLHAALVGVAFGIRTALEALPYHHKTATLRLVGGGSEHPAWRQMLADILHQELLTVETSAASVRGAALLAGIASGIWSNAQDTASVAPTAARIATPDRERAALYDKIYARYLEKCRSL